MSMVMACSTLLFVRVLRELYKLHSKKVLDRNLHYLILFYIGLE